MPRDVILPWYVFVVANHARKSILLGVIEDGGTVRGAIGAPRTINDRWRVECARSSATATWRCDVDEMERLATIRCANEAAAKTLVREMIADDTLRFMRCPKTGFYVDYSLVAPPEG